MEPQKRIVESTIIVFYSQPIQVLTADRVYNEKVQQKLIVLNSGDIVDTRELWSLGNRSLHIARVQWAADNRGKVLFLVVGKKYREILGERFLRQRGVLQLVTSKFDTSVR